FASEGIHHQTSVARTPEQNDVLERRNRTLVEAAQTMLSATKVPLSFGPKQLPQHPDLSDPPPTVDMHRHTPLPPLPLTTKAATTTAAPLLPPSRRHPHHHLTTTDTTRTSPPLPPHPTIATNSTIASPSPSPKPRSHHY
nr:ribonuclease H-like domain-containing protein [Tanacetum cinerariifolium]